MYLRIVLKWQTLYSGIEPTHESLAGACEGLMLSPMMNGAALRTQPCQGQQTWNPS